MIPLIPVVIGAAAAAASVMGGKKAYDGYQASQEADHVKRKSERMLDDEVEKLEAARKSTQDTLAQLGEMKIRVGGGELARCVSLLELAAGQVDIEPSIKGGDSKKDFGEIPSDMRQMTENHASLIQAGISSLGSSALVGVGAYSAVGMFGTASTGTAIGTLSGAAANSATMAWLGGGALSAGGLGVTGGMAVLGGVVAAPALLVGGWMYAANSEEKLANAKEYRATVLEHVQQMRLGVDRLEDVQAFAGLYEEEVDRLRLLLDGYNERVSDMLVQKGIAENGSGGVVNHTVQFSDEDLDMLCQLRNVGKLVYEWLDLPILEEDGSMTDEAYAAWGDLEQGVVHSS